jgi:hypothetical protein
MKLITPTQITDAQLVSSSVPETDFGVWDVTTTYGAGNTVIKGHRIWESVQAGNIGRDPQTTVAGWWLDKGPTNRWAMFDGVVGTSTTAATSMTVTLRPGRIDSLVLMEVDAAEVIITQRVGATIITQRTLSLIEGVTDWFDYFFSPIVSRDFVVITDLPVYGESTVEITLSKNAGTIGCGICIVGLKADLGLTRISPSIGINDYSRKTTDDFGKATLVRRGYSKRGSFRLVVDNREVDRVFSTLADARAIPSVWVGDDQLSALLLYGFFRDFELDIAYATVSYCTLNIEGMI